MSYYEPAVKLVGVLLTCVMEVEAEIRIDANAEVVVHHQDLRVVLVVANPLRYSH